VTFARKLPFFLIFAVTDTVNDMSSVVRWLVLLAELQNLLVNDCFSQKFGKGSLETETSIFDEECNIEMSMEDVRFDMLSCYSVSSRCDVNAFSFYMAQRSNRVT